MSAAFQLATFMAVFIFLLLIKFLNVKKYKVNKCEAEYLTTVN